MEIHYIWINNFGPYKKRGINLSSKFFINLEITGSRDGKKTGKLFIKDNPSYIHNFFNKSNIISISGIIGKNGAGKSSILNYIKSHLPEGLEANVNSDIIAYSVEKNGLYTSYVFHPEDWLIELIDETTLFKQKKYRNFPTSIETFKLSTHLAKADYIYYSFFIDYNSESADWAGLKNISTSNLIAEERRKVNEENRPLSFNPSTKIYASDLDLFIGKRLLPFKHPSSLIISIDPTDRSFFSDSNSDHADVYQLIKRLDNLNLKDHYTNRHSNSLLIALLINLLITERKYSSNMNYSHDFTIKRGDTVRKFIVRFFESLKDFRFKYQNNSVAYPQYEEKSKTAIEFINYFDELLSSNFISYINANNTQTFEFQLNDKSDSTFNKFMNLYLNLKGLTSFLNFRWRSLSTGEQSFLSLVSRFYHIKKHEIGKDDLKKNLVILIDEGDAGYHPEWQRKFFKETIEFLSSLFSDHKLQIIFTANAPFLTSDLPKFCITFIEKKSNDDFIVHEKDNNQSETFGSNIHTLFSDSFYMDGALIGAFAKEKIDSIIKYLNQKDITRPDGEYKKTIDLIGEPILRRKLQSMWNEKFGLDEELEQLQKRIEEIKKLKSEK